MSEPTDVITLRRVANGWVILPGGAWPNDFTHVATTPEEAAEHVRAWAQAQTGATVPKKGDR